MMATIRRLLLMMMAADLSRATHVDLLPVCEVPFGVTLETIDLVAVRDGALTCAMYCRQNRQCRSILFNQAENKCILNKEDDVEWSGCGIPDSLFAPVPPVTTMRQPCSVDEECVDGQSECRNGKCGCIPGRSFKSESNECVENCPSGYGNTYQTDLGYVIWGFSDRTVYGTLEQCMQECIDETSFVCRHVEVWIGYDECYLSEDTAITADAVNPGAFRADVEYNLYHRDCA